MNYDFYADENDKLKIIEFVLNDLELEIFELSSEFGEKIRSFSSAKKLASTFDLVNGNLHFQLWSPRHKGEAIFRKVELSPQYCDGHTFRYSTEGWGLIQFYLGGKVKVLGTQNIAINKCHIGHYSVKGAKRWEDVVSRPSVESWDWEEINRTSRKLRYHISKRLAVDKIGSIGILPGANDLRTKGFRLS